MIMLRSQSMSRGEKERESTRAPTSPPRSEVGTVVRALAFHQCGPGSNPSVKAILFREVFL